MRSLASRLLDLLHSPLLLAYAACKPVIGEDLRRRKDLPGPPTREHIRREVRHREFRGVLYLRLQLLGGRWGIAEKVMRRIWPPPIGMGISCDEVGRGFDIMHGVATIVSAESIGEDVTIAQQVTVGAQDGQRPTIGNRVSIMAGAIIIGGVHVGDGSIVGAGAVVVKDVPAGKAVGGVPARVLGPSARAAPTD